MRVRPASVGAGSLDGVELDVPDIGELALRGR